VKRLCETPGISSSEGAIRKPVAEEQRPIVDDLDADVMGKRLHPVGGWDARALFAQCVRVHGFGGGPCPER